MTTVIKPWIQEIGRLAALSVAAWVMEAAGPDAALLRYFGQAALPYWVWSITAPIVTWFWCFMILHGPCWHLAWAVLAFGMGRVGMGRVGMGRVDMARVGVAALTME
jgi:hypothetical protein